MIVYLAYGSIVGITAYVAAVIVTFIITMIEPFTKG